MEPIFDDKARLRALLRAVARPRVGADFLMARAAEELEARLGLVDRRFDAPVALFCRTGHAADAIAASGRAAAPALRIEQHATLLAGAEGQVIPAPDELDLPEGSADLAVSLLALHAVDDLSGLLARIRRILRPDGLFMAAIPAAGTLNELSDVLLAADAEVGAAAPRMLPLVDIRQAGALLQQAGFALPVVDVETVTVRYSTLDALLADLRAIGETNMLRERRKSFTRRGAFERAGALYRERFADPGGRLRATFATLWLSGWAPHPAQPQPLRRGSATMSLEKALREAGG